jgi:hypothetical protein
MGIVRFPYGKNPVFPMRTVKSTKRPGAMFKRVLGAGFKPVAGAGSAG